MVRHDTPPPQHARHERSQQRRIAYGAALRKPSRLGRTILLGTLAVALALVWLARELQLDPHELLGYLGVSVLFIAIPIVLGLLAAFAVRLLKRGLRKVRSR